MSLITVLRPDKPAEIPGSGPAPHPAAVRTPIPDGSVLTLIDNGKSHAKIVLEMVAEQVMKRIPQITTVEILSKTSAGLIVTDAQARDIASRSALVITGLGDCGACSSCSTLDAITFEKLGIPATVIITDPFVGLVERFAKKAGMPGYHTVVLPHPMATRPDAEVRALVAGIADEVVAHLTTPVGAAARALVGVL